MLVQQLGEYTIALRLLRLSDAPELTSAYLRNAEHLAPWEPVRPREYFTAEFQAQDISTRLAQHELGLSYPLAAFDGVTLVGRFNLTGVVRGPFQSASLGYWVDARYAGRGLATWAVKSIIDLAQHEFSLHRLEAGTLTHNIASQRVLKNAGFTEIGVAERYLKINGQWQDHTLYQRILES